MTAVRAVTLLTDFVFIGVFISTLITALRTRRSASVDIALFFAAGAGAVGLGLLGVRGSGAFHSSQLLLLAMPVLLLRIVGNFTPLSRTVMTLGFGGFALSALAVLFWPEPYPRWLVLPLIGYVIASDVYATIRFAERARTAHGSRKRRKQAVAVGTSLLASIFFIGGLRAFFPQYGDQISVLTTLGGTACTLGYFLGFAPPALIRRGWQYPEVVTFIAKLNEATSAKTFTEMIRHIEDGLAAAFGTPNCVVALWDDRQQRLIPVTIASATTQDRTHSSIAYRAFAEARAIFVDDASRLDPVNRDLYERYNVTALLTAPLLAAGRPIGVVSLFGDTPPLFADDDIATLTALAAPVAAAIQNWQLNEERAASAAFEESLALERDFLTAAAHELRTPLTSILGESQLLERRLATGALDRAADNAAHISMQSMRMRDLVNDLLSVARDSSGWVDDVEVDDLSMIAGAVARDFPTVRLDTRPVEVPLDARRIGQVIRNLLDNASKYSPSGAPIDMRIYRRGGDAIVEVEDRGMGVPAAERDRIFERFVRGAATQQTDAEGMGLGLYLCRRIVDEHGGRIWVETNSAGGSTFFVSLPVHAPDAAPPAARPRHVEDVEDVKDSGDVDLPTDGLPADGRPMPPAAASASLG